MVNNNKKQFNVKYILKIIFAFVLVLIQSAFFYFVWLDYYNLLLRIPYLMKGNFFVSGIFALIYTIFMFIFDSFNIDENKLGNTLFSYLLTTFFTNILMYFIVIMPTYSMGFVRITPLIETSIKQVVFSFVFVTIFYYFIKFSFPIDEMLIVSDNEHIDALYTKLYDRKDIFNIKSSISSDEGIDKVYSACDKFSSVIIGDISSNTRNDIIKYCYANNKTTYVLPKLSDIIIRNSKELYAIDAPIYYSNNFGLDLINSFFKRVFDIICSIIFIIITLPLLIIVAILIKVEDGGKVLFIQERVTKDNKIFKIYKFRSMKEDNTDKVIPTKVDDDRITKIGSFIRKFHIDELPQLFNVLKGEMSLVGPRPERIEHVELYTSQIIEFKYRANVKAGITGLAQIYGRYNTTAYDKLKLDLIYISNYSVLFDLELIMKTFKVFIMKENTEGFDETTSNKISKEA